MGDEENGMTAALRALARLHRVLEATDSGLTLPQYRMLTALSEGGERSARLAERLTIRKPTVTALADGLVAAGYAERSSEPGDRRIVRLHITDDGRKALERAEQAYGERLAAVLDEVPDSQRCVQALIAIGEGLDRRARRAGSDARSASSRAEADARSASSRAEADARSASSRAEADARSASSRAEAHA